MNETDALNTMLWLYRRLPRAYGRPPFVEAAIKGLAAKAGVDVREYLAERDTACSLCEGAGFIGQGMTCPHCDGRRVEP